MGDKSGPAFPVTLEQLECSSEGLTKREWFAGMAMQALIVHYGNNDTKALVRESYDAADAMLKEAGDE